MNTTVTILAEAVNDTLRYLHENSCMDSEGWDIVKENLIDPFDEIEDPRHRKVRARVVITEIKEYEIELLVAADDDTVVDYINDNADSFGENYLYEDGDTIIDAGRIYTMREDTEVEVDISDLD